MTASFHVSLGDPEATDRFGAALADALPPDLSAVVFLDGDLGAGKTSLARAMLRRLGVTGPIRSPTYALIERYPLADGGECAHLDLYRISDPEELEYLALDELAVGSRLWLVEWPQRGAGQLPPVDLRISLVAVHEGREARLDGVTPAGQRWLASLATD